MPERLHRRPEEENHGKKVIFNFKVHSLGRGIA
jgi:hypothetical protein